MTHLLDKEILGVDFGTTNTYLTRYNPKTKNKAPLQLSTSAKTGISTTLLKMESGELFIGEEASDEYGLASADECRQYGYEYFSHFKPDIHHSDKARAAAVEFLRAVVDEANKRNLQYHPQRYTVLFGVPSEASNEYRASLKKLAEDAGYGSIDLVDEPVGALMDAIHAGHVPLELLMEGCLVVDVGGGTCDFAFMRNGKVVYSWGDMDYGGRLFDDLFYQWLLDNNEEDREKIEADGYFIRTRGCRELKEKFSESMEKSNVRKQSDAAAVVRPFRGSVEGFSVGQMTWEEFLDRAARYSPSQSLLKFQEKTGVGFSRSISFPKNLLTWLEEAFESETRLRKEEIKSCILAGGSSLWPFVKEYCEQKLGIPSQAITRSDSPYAAISEGIAVHHVIQNEFKANYDSLKQRKTEFINNMIINTVHRELLKSARKIVDRITGELFDKKIRPQIVAFREMGGKISVLKQTIELEAKVFEPEINSITREEIAHANIVLSTEMFKSIERWFNKSKIKMIRHHASEASFSKEVSMDYSIDVLGNITGGITAVISSAVLLVVAGGAILSGPIGWITGALAVGGAYLFGQTVGKGVLEDNELPSTMLKAVLWDSRIDACRDKLVIELENSLIEIVQKVLDDLRINAAKLVDDQLEKLSFVNNM